MKITDRLLEMQRYQLSNAMMGCNKPSGRDSVEKQKRVLQNLLRRACRARN